MKGFISSVIQGFEEYGAPCCEHATRSVTRLGGPRTSQRRPRHLSRPVSPRVRWADVVVLLVGGRYGEPRLSGLSATHEEYREALERAPVLAFVQEGWSVIPRSWSS